MEQRTKNVTFVVTPSEFEALRHMAFEEHKTMSTFLRDLVLGKTDLAKRASFFRKSGREVVHKGTEVIAATEAR